MQSYLLLFVFLFHLVQCHKVVKRQEQQGPESREVAPGVYAFTSTGDYISMFVVTTDGVMVVDSMSTAHSQAMLQEIRKITNAPIKYLFYSHNHWDHTKGGQVWKNEGATIVSHVDAYNYIRDNPSQDLVLPDMKWTGDRFDMTLGNTKIELHFSGNSHGNGMTTFVLPREKVGYIADLAVPNQVIFFAMPDFNVPGMVKALEEYTRYDVDKIIFSHSANPDPLEPGTQENVRFTIKYLNDIQDAVLKELQAGANPFTLWKTVKLPQYSNLAQYDNWFELNVLAVTISNVLGPLAYSPPSSSSSSSTRSSSRPSTSSSASAPSYPRYPQLPTYSSSGSHSSNSNRYNQNNNNRYNNHNRYNGYGYNQWRPTQYKFKHYF